MTIKELIEKPQSRQNDRGQPGDQGNEDFETSRQRDK
jgi:hypothetical protein